VIGEDGAPLPHSFGSNGTLFRAHSDTYEALCQLSIGLFPDQFVPKIAAPEIDTGHLKEFT